MLNEYIKNNSDAYQSKMGEHFNWDISIICRTLEMYKITWKKRLGDTRRKDQKQ